MASGATLFIFLAWIYNSKDQTVYDYWRQVEQGRVPVEEYDDDDDDDEEEFDEDEDEWADDSESKE